MELRGFFISAPDSPALSGSLIKQSRLQHAAKT